MTGINPSKLILSARAFLLRSYGHHGNTVLPLDVAGYKLIHKLESQNTSPFKVGLYQDHRGKKVVIKIWQGEYKDIYYFNLVHQAECLSVLNSIHSRIHLNISSKIRHVRTPEMISFTDRNKQAILITEYISGQPLKNIKSAASQIKYYQFILDYLKVISSNCSSKEIDILGKKTLSYYFVIFPIIWTVALLENPKLFILLMKLLPAYFYSGFSLKGNTDLTIVHGDLNLNNIYIKGKNIYLLDIEQLSYTFPEFEYASSLSALNTTAPFKEYIAHQIKKTAQLNQYSKRRLVFSLLNCQVHNLTWYAPQKHISWFKKLITYTLNQFTFPTFTYG